MNVLVTYFSQTGNTKKIAKAIYEEAAQTHQTELKKLEEITPADAAKYDFIFIGSPLHSGTLAAPVQKFLNVLQSSSDQKMAAFITHFSPAYPEQDLDQFIEPVIAACKDNGIEYKGCFNCQGLLAEPLHGSVQQKMNLTNETWTKMVQQMTGHPNEKDKAKAKLFSKTVLA